MDHTNEKFAPGFTESRYNFLALVVGVLGGLVGAAFHLSLDALVDGYARLIAFVGGGMPAITVAIILSSSMAVLAAYLVRRFAPEASGSGIQQIEGAMAGKLHIRWFPVLWVKFVAGLLALGSGLVLGREGPTIHLCAAVAKGVSDCVKGICGEQERRGLLAAGAAAGLAAAFYAPLAAILFVTEEMQRHFPFRRHTYTGLIIAAVAAAIVAELIGGRSSLLDLPVSAMSFHLYPVVIVLGAIIGALAVGFNHALIFALNAADKIPSRLWWVPAMVMGGGSGLLMITFADAVYGGEDLVKQLTATNMTVIALLLLVVLRFAGSVLSYSVGTPGGIFAPILAIAVSAGLAIGTIAEQIVPIPNANVVCAILAMGAFFTASVRAPLVATVLVLELTNTFALLLPLMTACLTALLMAHLLRGKPVYHMLLERTLAKTKKNADADRC